MKNTARKFQNEELYSNIKNELDVTTLNNFLITSPDKAIAAIGYWERKMQNATKEQKDLYMIQINKLEALMEKMVDLSLDVYGVNAEAYLDAKGNETVVDTEIDKVIGETVKTDDTDKDDAKVVSIFDGEKEVKTPKLSDLAQACKQLLKKGNFDSAALMAGKYLTIGDYVPKKEKQKAKKWTEKEIDSWLKDLNSNLMEEKREVKKEEIATDGPKEEKTKDVAAIGLTTQEVENLSLLNLIITDSIAGHQDPGSRKETLKRYLTRGEDLKTEEEMLSAYAKRKYDATHGAKLPEADLAVLCSALEKFAKIFFAHRGYTEESVKAWHEYASTNFDEADPSHFKFLKAKTGVTLFPIKKETSEEKKTDPDLEKAKIIPEDKVDVSQVRALLANIYKNGGEISDLKLNPEITGLINKEIHVNDKVPVLKFGNESTLFPWLENLYNEIAKKIGPLKKATDEEVANESAKTQENSEVKAETEKIAEEKKKVIGPIKPSKEQQLKPGEIHNSIASLEDFTLLIETAAKNNITIDDFLKEHSSFVMNENGSIKKLMSKAVEGKAISSVILADKKDLKTWVTEVYKRFAKSDNPIVATEETTDENLVSSFKALIPKGKELLSKGTPYDKFMDWLNKNLLNRKMTEQKACFNTPEMVAKFAEGTFKVSAKQEVKKVEKTEEVGEPSQQVNESTPYSVEDIASVIAEESKQKDMTFIMLARMLRDLYVSNEIEVDGHACSVKDAIEVVEKIVKDSNPDMYVDRIKRKAEKEASEKGQGKLPLDEVKKDETETKNEIAQSEPETKIESSEHPIFEKVDLRAQDAELYEKTIIKIDTMDALYNMAVEYHEAGKYNEGLSLCLERMPAIEESKDWTPEQITAWYNTNILNKGPVEDANEVAENTEKIVDTTETEEEFTKLQEARNSKHFRRAIAAILAKHADSNELRNRIIESIKTGKGSHTRQVAKMPEGEMQKQITNIKGKVEKAEASSTEE